MLTPEERDDAIDAGIVALGQAAKDGDQETVDLLAFHVQRSIDKAAELERKKKK